jgi:beta-glucosidase
VERVAGGEPFLWGASTSAYQTEGGNVGSDCWAVEHVDSSPCAEPSGDACDSWHRWDEDLDLAAELGLTAYRFSIEWARVEPAPGQVSLVALDHYSRMVAGCVERGIVPVVTLHHFTLPLWLHERGGWLAPEAAERFASYVASLLPVLTPVPWVCTINEPNVVGMVDALRRDPTCRPGLPRAELTEALVSAHRAARAELRDLPSTRVGWTVAMQDVQALPGGEDRAEEVRRRLEEDFLVAAREDDFLGIQAYTRMLIGPEGQRLPGPHVATTLTGWERYPAALEHGLCRAAEVVPGLPLLVTENGIATRDCEDRIGYTTEALQGMHAVMAAGVDVRGYLHWSLLDNYEWGSYAATFGLVAVDRTSFQRTVKRSGRWYGEVIARGGRLDSLESEALVSQALS